MWEKAKIMTEKELYEALSLAEDEIYFWSSDPYIGSLTKENQEAYDSLSLWIRILEEEETTRDMCLCKWCSTNDGRISMGRMCAECYNKEFKEQYGMY